MVTPRALSSADVVSPFDTLTAGWQYAAVKWTVHETARMIRRARERRIRKQIEEELREYTNRLREVKDANEARR